MRTVALTGASNDPFTTMYGGLVAVLGKVYRGAYNRQVYRYDIATGLYDNVVFSTDVDINNMVG